MACGNNMKSLRTNDSCLSQFKLGISYRKLTSYSIISDSSFLHFIHTSWKVSVFGVFLVHISPHSNIRILSECGKIRTWKTPNTNTFHTVLISLNFLKKWKNSHKILTHFSPVSHFYTPWKRQKNLWFSDVFRGYRNVALV